MPGPGSSPGQALVPGIHVLSAATSKDVDGRDKPGHDGAAAVGPKVADVLQLVVAGLATGGVYALAAIGFTLLWQTSQTVNFAQGEFVMVPAFFILVAMKGLGLSFWPAVAVGIMVSVVVLGILFKKLMVDPMIRHGVLPLVIATIALGLLLRETVKDFYGAEAQPFPPLAEATQISIAGP